MRKIIQKSFGGSVKPAGELHNTIKRGHTGRDVPVGTDYFTAHEWSECAGIEQILAHRAAGRFREELNVAPIAVGGDLNCVRGCRNDRSITGWEHMGPPSSVGRDGRYNSTDEIVLYLCDTDTGVFREMSAKSGQTLFLQDYRLDSKVLRVVDFSAAGLTEFVKAVFDLAENSKLEGRVGRSDYIFSQVIARLVQDAGFDGMIVPGVRGNSSCHYSNVVLFEVLGRWTEWSLREAGFRRVIVP